MMRALLTAAVTAALVIACGGGGPATTPAGTPAVTVQLSAANSAFEETSLSVPAGVTFAIDFDNKDSAPHNVAIVGGPAGAKGEIFGGPGERVYVFPALSAGTYTFHCDVHPNMTGTIQAI